MAKTLEMWNEKKSAYAYPSRFGSHTIMIDQEATSYLSDNNMVVIKDEHGIYTTERKKLDNGMADPNRYATSRLGKLFARTAKEK